MEILICPDTEHPEAISEHVYLLWKNSLFKADLNEVLHLYDPSIAPIVCKTTFDAQGFSEFGSNRYCNHQFIDRMQWSILKSPQLFSQPGEGYDAEISHLKEIWGRLQMLAGATLVFRVPSSSKTKKWKNASEIVRGLETKIRELIFVRPPRAGTAKDDEMAESLKEHFALMSEDQRNERLNYKYVAHFIGVDPEGKGRALRRHYKALEAYLFKK